jgi:two-component system response regulator FixJ
MTGKGPVHIVDDDVVVRASLQELLCAAGFATILYDSGDTLLEAMAAGPAMGCLLLDVKMPGIGGLELQRRLAERGVRLPVIMMTGASDVRTAVQAMKAGAVDFIEKPIGDERLFQALQVALATAGDRARAREIAAAGQRVATLSPRERAVLDGLVMGHPNKIIAADLGISVRTVEMHRAHMLERLGVGGLGEAVRLAVMAALVSFDDEQEPQPPHPAVAA